MIDRLELPIWAEQLAGLLIASSAIIALAWLTTRFMHAARWQRGIWQAAVLAWLALAGMELSGAGTWLTVLGRLWWTGTREQVSLHGVHQEHQPVAPSGSADGTRWSGVAVDDSGAGLPATGIAVDSCESFTGRFGSINSGSNSLEAADSVSAPDRDRSQSANGVASTTIKDRAPSPRESKPTATELSIVAESHSDRMADVVAGPLRGCLLAWITGFSLLLTHSAMCQARLLRMVRRGCCVAVPYRAHVQKLASALGYCRAINVREIPGLAGPVAFGLWRPTIGLPQGFSRRHSRSEQDAMLAHELAHLSGADPLWRIATDLMVAVWWWQPLAWLTRGQLRAVSELVADEASLLLDHGPETLATCLVELGRRLVRSRQLGWSGIEGGGFRSALGQRVVRLLNLEGRAWCVPRPVRMSLAVTLFAVILAAAAWACAAGTRPTTWQESGETNMTIQQAWRRSLGGLTLFAAFAAANTGVADEGRDPAIPPPPGVERKEGQGPRVERRGPEGPDRRGPDGPDRGGPRDEGGRRDVGRRDGGDDGRLDRLKRDAQRLREEGKADDAARVEKEFREALSKMLKYIMPQLPEDVRGKLMPKIEEYFKARDEGKYEDADRIEKEAKEIMKPFEDKVIDPKRKIHHLRNAADNLRAAGMNDLAEKLSEQVRQMEQDLGLPPLAEGERRDDGRGRETRGRDGAGPDRRGPDARPAEGRGQDRRGPDGDNARRGDERGNPVGRYDEGRGTDPQQELFRVLRDLRNDVENLRREVQELRNRPGQPERRKPTE